MTARRAPLLVLAVGNPSRGDDAAGPAVVQALRRLGVEDDGTVELLEDFQLQVEHVLDLAGRQAVLFVDAARPGAVSAGVVLHPLEVVATVPTFSHALAPEAVLGLARRMGIEPPAAWLLAIEGQSFGLGDSIHTFTLERLRQAVDRAQGWIVDRRAALDSLAPQPPAPSVAPADGCWVLPVPVGESAAGAPAGDRPHVLTGGLRC